MRKRRKKKNKPVDPYDVLAERASITARELVQLIHRINPTRTPVGPTESAERYKLKAGLQSLLIRRFALMLTVEQPDPRNTELISLKLGPFGRDACHALITELDEDARSWVQRQLDEMELEQKKI